jgi:hypothetical protein
VDGICGVARRGYVGVGGLAVACSRIGWRYDIIMINT